MQQTSLWRETRDPYRIGISETMLQQTQAPVVILYYNRFLARFPDMQNLAAAGQDDVLKTCPFYGADLENLMPGVPYK